MDFRKIIEDSKLGNSLKKTDEKFKEWKRNWKKQKKLARIKLRIRSRRKRKYYYLKQQIKNINHQIL